MVITHNIPALNAATNLQATSRKMGVSYGRLSSGVKLNSSKDNPSGLAIVTKIKYQLAGLESASKNSMNGISLVQTAEGALTEVHNMLQRMRELAIQSATDTMESDDRQKIQLEIDGLSKEITDISRRTVFNNIKLLNGGGSRMAYSDDNMFTNTADSRVNASQIAKVSYISDTVPPGELVYSIKEAGVPAMAAFSLPTTTVPADGSFSINGVSVDLKAGETRDEVFKKMRDACDIAGINVDTNNIGGTDNICLTTWMAGSDQSIVFTYSSTQMQNWLSSSSPITSKIGSDAELDNVVFRDSVTDEPIKSFDDTKTVVISGNRVEVSASNGQMIKIDLQVKLVPDSANTPPWGFVYQNDNPIDTRNAGTITEMGATITDYGPLKLQIGPNHGMDMDIQIPVITGESLGLTNMNYQTAAGATKAIGMVDWAIGEVSTIRAKMGAYQNRLEYTVQSLDATAESTEKSRSRIEDTDMAEEMTRYTQLSVMEQAAISILAQANQRPQQILSLISG